ncbi:MAG: CDP-alcohol phosphatidyltransferase family protein [Rhodospirillaceae bacterium]|nr:CDP-alcohol phosphatidyltransferase family protein [Rhodospirillaceae bacterium]
MERPPWDQQIAARLVRPLIKTPVTPNMVTLVTLVIALAGAGLFVPGDPKLANWGAGLFVLARFLDHFDGELARQSGKTSKLGYYLDYISGAISYAALFACLGFGFQGSALGMWAIVLGLAGAASALFSMFLNLGIDEAQQLKDGDAVGYPGYGGFELEDGIYLIAPITWAGFLLEFFTAAGIGAAIYTLWSLLTLLRLRKKSQ